MQQTFFKDYLNLLQGCHNDILEALEGLSPTALDWKPGPETNSISVLVFHLTGSERYWIGDVAAQDPSGRDRDAEFRVHEVDVQILKEQLADNFEYALNTLDKMDIHDMESNRVTTSGREITVGWALLHALEHATLHVGQIQLTRQLWEQSKGNA